MNPDPLALATSARVSLAALEAELDRVAPREKKARRILATLWDRIGELQKALEESLQPPSRPGEFRPSPTPSLRSVRPTATEHPGGMAAILASGEFHEATGTVREAKRPRRNLANRIVNPNSKKGDEPWRKLVRAAIGKEIPSDELLPISRICRAAGTPTTDLLRLQMNLAEHRAPIRVVTTSGSQLAMIVWR